MAQQSPVSTNAATQWIKQYGNAMLDAPEGGIIALGVGKKSTGPLDDTSAFCLTAFVERKLTSQQLKSRALTSFARCVSSLSAQTAAARDFELDVVETGSMFSAKPRLSVDRSQRGPYGGARPSVDLQKRFTKLRSGIGITNPVGAYPDSLSVGTLGFFVSDAEDQKYLVSNNHVIANENRARVGNAIVQPGTLDLTETELGLLSNLDKLRKELQIAKLSAWIDIEYPDDDGVPLNQVDCAVAELVPSDRDESESARVGLGGESRGLGPNFRIDATTGRLTGSPRVYKAGRTTGWTEGDVVAINVLSDVGYSAGVARFSNQIAIKPTVDNSGPFSNAGDSGSGIYNTKHQLVGLLFAGSETRTLANPARLVVRKLQNALGRGRLTVQRG